MPQAQLATTQFGSTGLEITRVGFGAWAIGGGEWEFGWGPQDDGESIAAIHRALERGVNWIDTAAGYGFGRSEEVVGRALEGVEQRPYVFTKCSLLEGPGRKVVHNLKRDSVRREAEASLERLRVDGIDLYQIHWPNPEADIEEGFAAMQEPQLTDHLATADRVSSVAERLGVAPGAVAVAWTLRNPAVDAAIVGLRRPDQVDELLAAATIDLSDEDAAELEGSHR